ncbi:MAG: peptide deformylase [Proteobacteria bacterium]|nr:peptide deformylase [Pseudomonadota bacterium]MBU1612619.1 peptide deformylase [Pseudomonadota bacterium]
MKLKIITWPDPILSTVSEPLDIDEIKTPEFSKLVEDMIQTMYEDDGVGLAAPQIGRNIRLITVDQTGPRERADLMVIINPEIVENEGSMDSRESCLSTPAFTTTVNRFEKLTVTGLDHKGKPMRIEAEELLAVILQHEIDHLDGITIVERAGRLKRAMYEKKVMKWRKG